MNAKKSPSKNLENKRIIFFEIGAIITLALVFLAFEWKSYEPINFERGWRSDVIVIDEDIVIQTKHEKDIEIPKPKIQISKLIIIDNPNIEYVDVIVDVGIDPDDIVPEYFPEIPDEPNIPGENPPLPMAGIQPEFPGGMQALHLYLKNNINYPEQAKNVGISGTVYISFVVERDGSVTNILLWRGIGGGCDEEALRVVESMPRWNPGLQNTMPVRVQMTLPIEFKLY